MSQDLKHWKPVPSPSGKEMSGRYGILKRLSRDEHAQSLYEEFSKDGEGAIWEYLPYGPFGTFEAFSDFIADNSANTDPLFFAILDKATGEAIGLSSYLRIDPSNGVIEIGHLAFSPRLQRTRIATEAIYLLLRHVFALGYRRVEWKCNNNNVRSKRAANRFGFQYEGLFRQAAVVKGRNRDTAWYSIIDSEMERVLGAFEAWLSPENFDGNAVQIQTLAELRGDHRPGP